MKKASEIRLAKAIKVKDHKVSSTAIKNKINLPPQGREISYSYRASPIKHETSVAAEETKSSGLLPIIAVPMTNHR